MNVLFNNNVYTYTVHALWGMPLLKPTDMQKDIRTFDIKDPSTSHVHLTLSHILKKQTGNIGICLSIYIRIYIYIYTYTYIYNYEFNIYIYIIMSMYVCM